MPWLALTLEVERSAADAFSDALLEAGAQSVCVEGQRLSALVAVQDDAQSLLAAAAASAGIAMPSFSIETVQDQDWVRASQAQFAPLTIGARLWVGASWHRPPADRVAVRIDPGLAFGTGSHASTRLVLQHLEQTIRGGECVLDYGCGSGILAIAAAKLGAAQVHCTDIDPQAVQATLANARLNGVHLDAESPDALPEAVYDLVVSNILAQPLIVLAPLFARRGRRIALSGILEPQAAEVRRAYEPWFEISVAADDDGWALLAGKAR